MPVARRGGCASRSVGMKPLTASVTVTICADGETLAADAVRALTAVRVEHALGDPAQCELTFVDGGCPLAIGMAITLTVAGHPGTLFAGEVTAIEHVYEPMRGRITRARAYD